MARVELRTYLAAGKSVEVEGQADIPGEAGYPVERNVLKNVP